MKRVVLLAVMLAVPVVAQSEERTNKLLMVKNIDPNFVVNMFNNWGVSMNLNNQTKSLAISGPADKVAAVEAAIKLMDMPPKNVELTVYFVVGGDQATLAGGAVPQDLRDVITQLKGTFAFKDYKMLDALTLRTRAGSSADTSGILNSATPPKMSQFSIRNSTVSEDGTTIRIDRMHAGLRIPVARRETATDTKSGTAPQRNWEYITSGIDQDVDVKVGQKVVVGRSSLEGPHQALFLILTAQVIQ